MMVTKNVLAAFLMGAFLPMVAVAQTSGTQPKSGNTVSNVSTVQSGSHFLEQIGRDSVNEIHEA